MSGDLASVLQDLCYCGNSTCRYCGYARQAREMQAEIERLRAEVERLRALITEWDATCEALRRPPRQWSEGDWHDAEVRLGAAVNALIEEARRG